MLRCHLELLGSVGADLGSFSAQFLCYFARPQKTRLFAQLLRFLCNLGLIWGHKIDSNLRCFLTPKKAENDTFQVLLFQGPAPPRDTLAKAKVSS